MEENKYKDVLKGIIKIIRNAEHSDIGFASICTYIGDHCPELENKDEEIRKKLIEYFKGLMGGWFPYSNEEIIAYLEKMKDFDEQLEQAYKTADEVQYNRGYQDAMEEKEKFVDAITDFPTEFEKQVSCFAASIINKEYDYDYSFIKWAAKGLLEYAKHELEKQGEHANFQNKIQIGDKVTRNEDGVLVNLSQLNRVAKKDEKQAAIKDGNSIDPHFRKPITTTETKYPKFKIGDWVVDEEDNHVYQVKRVVTNVSSGMSGYDLSDGGYFYSTKTNCHLWSIADAKDGDILVSKQDYPFIYNGKHDGESVGAYCGMTVNAEFIESQTICSWTINKGSIKPATKEQCELLFRKMEEAGYAWNPITKELSQISVTKKSDKVWNEDDEKNLQGVIDEIQANKSSAPEYDLKTYDKFLSWLKSIKDRIQPHPKQVGWSEEDEEMKYLIDGISCHNDDVDYETHVRIMRWLNELKQRLS